MYNKINILKKNLNKIWTIKNKQNSHFNKKQTTLKTNNKRQSIMSKNNFKKLTMILKNKKLNFRMSFMKIEIKLKNKGSLQLQPFFHPPTSHQYTDKTEPQFYIVIYT